MKFKILGIALLITTSTFSARYAVDDNKNNEQMRTKDDVRKNRRSIGKRTENREEGRKIQKAGKNIKKGVEAVHEPLEAVGTIATFLAVASGDPHAKAAVSTLRVAIQAFEKLGEGISTIVIGVGRYRERSQEILSITEAMVEEIVKSEEEIKSLEKAQRELLKLDKAPETPRSCNLYFTSKDEKIDADQTPALKKLENGEYRLFVRQKKGTVSDALDLKELGFDNDQVENLVKIWTNKEDSQTVNLPCNGNNMKAIISKAGHIPKSASTLDKVTKDLGSIYAGRTALQRKVREATDIFSDEKAKRLEKLKIITEALNVEREHYEEMIKILEIKLLEDSIKKIDLKINIDKTINDFNKKIDFYKKDSKDAIVDDSTKSSSQKKKKLDKIDEDVLKIKKDLDYYQDLKLDKSPEIEPEKLKKDRATLTAEIDKLKSSTKLGESVYLEEKGLDSDNLVKRSTIVGIYREMDGMKEKIDDLSSRLEVLEKAGAPSRPWVKSTAVSR